MKSFLQVNLSIIHMATLPGEELGDSAALRSNDLVRRLADIRLDVGFLVGKGLLAPGNN